MCFTTVNRRPTKNFDGSELKNQFKLSAEEDHEEDEIELPDKSKTYKDAVLPNVLKSLVDKRRHVKNLMKNERDPVKL